MKLFIKLFSFLIMLIGLIFCFFFSLNYFTDKRLNLVEVYVASHNISPRSKIREEDLSIVTLPYAYIVDKAYINKEDILGKYTDIQGKIPRGSLFYKDMLFKEEDLSDKSLLHLQKNQTAFSLPADSLLLMGNSLVAGQRVDLYGILESDNKIISDLVSEDVRIISIKDNKGYDLDHPSSNKVASSINLALDNESFKYVLLLNKLGKIEIYASDDSYNTNESRLNKKSRVVEYIKSY